MGGISTGYLLVRLTRGIDVRSTGSGSAGATNAGRVLGRRGFYLTLIGDILKGIVIVLVAQMMGFQPGIVGAVAVAVIAGHIWPVWLQFHGGKGIATSLGAFAALDYELLLMGGLLLLIVYLISRNFLASWVAVLVATPLLVVFFNYPLQIVVPLFVSVVIVLYAHRKNIRPVSLPSVNKG